MATIPAPDECEDEACGHKFTAQEKISIELIAKFGEGGTYEIECPHCSVKNYRKTSGCHGGGEGESLACYAEDEEEGDCTSCGKSLTGIQL